ncbi:MAG: hypothetical protein H7Z74_13045 [Anaerolineae bacterium]|nr:hypothetical protein [Gemmatimonadaceae bacterium]
MATIVTYEMLNGPGNIWSRLLDIWLAWLPLPGSTIVFISGTGYYAYGGMVAQVNDGTDDYYYNLIDVSQIATDSRSVQLVQSSPGWNRLPPVLADAYGARVTRDEFSSWMWAARQTLWALCGYTISNPAFSIVNFTSPSFEVTSYGFAFYKGTQVGSDAIAITVAPVADIANWSNCSPFSNANTPGQISVTVQGGGGGTDLTPVVEQLQAVVAQMELTVETLQEIALSRLDVSLNHGQVIASVSTVTSSDGE